MRKANAVLWTVRGVSRGMETLYRYRLASYKRRPLMQPQDILLISAEPLGNLTAIAAPLLDWYVKSARSMPWRDDPKPYHVWLSEIMLQQTRVEAVRGYYTRFLTALPTIEALAQAPEDLLLKLWEGLGYYNRVRNLHKAAVVVVTEFGGNLPASYAALLSLPGIGEYTAGAIASIAFGIPVPAVDGNVLRVLSRILGSYGDISSPQVKAAHRRLLSGIIPAHRPGDFNQALMELGATVCLPNAAPRCLECPVAPQCAAREGGYSLELPVKAAKRARRVEQRTIILISAAGKLLLFRRGRGGLLAGMFEPLNLEGHLLAGEVEKVVSGLGGHPSRIRPMGVAKHLFTHVEWQMQGFWADTPPFSPPGDGQWADTHDLAATYALPSAFRAYTKHLPQLLAGME